MLRNDVSLCSRSRLPTRLQEVAERAAFFRLRSGEAPAAFAARIYARAFGSDIERLLRITDMWSKPGRTPPTPLGAISAAVASAVAAAPPGRSACASLGLKDAHATWDAEQAASVYLLSCARLAERLAADPDTPLTFDKDDVLAVEFVAASAALRGVNYGIPGQSLFLAKGMAGNIIHAIATTNAIISGLIVMEAVKLLRGQRDQLKCTWVQQFPNGRNALLVPTMPAPPSAACYVCRRQRLHLALDVGAWTLGQLIDDVLMPKLGVTAPTVTAAHTTLFEGGDGLDEDEVENYAALRKRTLPQLPCGGLGDGDIISVQDETPDGTFEVEIKLVQRAPAAGEDARAFDLQGNVPKPVAAPPPPPPPAEPAPPPAADAGDDVCIILDEGGEPEVGTKRKRGDEADEHPDDAKKGKPEPAAADDDDVIVL
jgi:ubiquitin-like 1-activating enzyme E1 B